MGRKVQIFENVVLIWPNCEIRKVESRALNQGTMHRIHMGPYRPYEDFLSQEGKIGPKIGPHIGPYIGPYVRTTIQ